MKQAGIEHIGKIYTDARHKVSLCDARLAVGFTEDDLVLLENADDMLSTYYFNKAGTVDPRKTPDYTHLPKKEQADARRHYETNIGNSTKTAIDRMRTVVAVCRQVYRGFIAMNVADSARLYITAYNRISFKEARATTWLSHADFSEMDSVYALATALTKTPCAV